MKWLLDNLWIVVVIAGVVAQLLKAVRGQTGGEETDAPGPEGKTFEDPELAEQTRRIRAEIQRKIEERTRGGALTQAPRTMEPADEPEPPVAIDLPPLLREMLAPRVEVVAASRAEQMRAAEEAERQQALAEQLHEAEQMKAAAARRVAFEAATADPEAANLTLARDSMLENLRDPAALRRAFVLREVLGPPMALR